MRAILLFHLLHLSRSRLLPLWLVFSGLTQYAVAKIVSSAVIQIQGAQAVLGVKETVTILLYTQFLIGGLLALVFGVWVVPYFHEENRAPLTFALPVSKWVFPFVYGFTFVGMLLLQVAMGLFVLFFQGGLEFFKSSAFPWQVFFSAQFTAGVALLVLVYLLSCLSFYVGKAAALILSAGFFFILQFSGIYYTNVRANHDSLWRKIYLILPPFGEVLLDLTDKPFWAGVGLYHSALWLFWLCALATVFRFRIARA